MRRVRFQGAEYLFVGDDLAEAGPIATVDEYAHGRLSFAHLYADGIILRHGNVIGSREDLEDLGACESPEIADDALGNMLGPGGGFPLMARLDAAMEFAKLLERRGLTMSKDTITVKLK